MCGQREIKMENKKYFELNENESTTHQNVWRAAKAIERAVLKHLAVLEKKEGLKSVISGSRPKTGKRRVHEIESKHMS